MIYTNELMLGNWVEYATGLKEDKRSIPMYVVGIFSDTVYLNFDGNEGDVFEEEEENLLGIPITEELLEKCGFRHITEDDGGNKEYFYGLVRVCISEHHTCVFSGTSHVFVTYLHELQNAYYMLTKKHLEVKL